MSQKSFFDDGVTVITGHRARDVFKDQSQETVRLIEFPENSLHPMEQVRKGEELVLGFVKTKTPVALRTFSPEILNSIKLYCQKYGVPLHVYVAEENELSLLNSDDLDKAFESLADSFDFLMALRSDLENPEESN